MVYNSGTNEMKKCLIALTTIAMLAFCSCSKSDGDPITQDFSVNGSYTELEGYTTSAQKGAAGDGEAFRFPSQQPIPYIDSIIKNA